MLHGVTRSTTTARHLRAPEVGRRSIATARSSPGGGTRCAVGDLVRVGGYALWPCSPASTLRPLHHPRSSCLARPRRATDVTVNPAASSPMSSRCSRRLRGARPSPRSTGCAALQCSALLLRRAADDPELAVTGLVHEIYDMRYTDDHHRSRPARRRARGPLSARASSGSSVRKLVRKRYLVHTIRVPPPVSCAARRRWRFRETRWPTPRSTRSPPIPISRRSSTSGRRRARHGSRRLVAGLESWRAVHRSLSVTGARGQKIAMALASRRMSDRNERSTSFVGGGGTGLVAAGLLVKGARRVTVPNGARTVARGHHPSRPGARRSRLSALCTS